MDTFLIEMSKKWMFTFKNFRNVYFHGKQHSAVVIKVTRWFWEPHSWQLMILIDSQSVNFTTFAILALFHNDGSGNFLFLSLYHLLSIHEKRFFPSIHSSSLASLGAQAKAAPLRLQAHPAQSHHKTDKGEPARILQICSISSDLGMAPPGPFQSKSNGLEIVLSAGERQM